MIEVDKKETAARSQAASDKWASTWYAEDVDVSKFDSHLEKVRLTWEGSSHLLTVNDPVTFDEIRQRAPEIIENSSSFATIGGTKRPVEDDLDLDAKKRKPDPGLDNPNPISIDDNPETEEERLKRLKKEKEHREKQESYDRARKNLKKLANQAEISHNQSATGAIKDFKEAVLNKQIDDFDDKWYDYGTKVRVKISIPKGGAKALAESQDKPTEESISTNSGKNEGVQEDSGLGKGKPKGASSDNPDHSGDQQNLDTQSGGQKHGSDAFDVNGVPLQQSAEASFVQINLKQADSALLAQLCDCGKCNEALEKETSEDLVRLYPCRHTFKSSCFNNFHRNASAGAADSVVCPVCHQLAKDKKNKNVERKVKTPSAGDNQHNFKDYDHGVIFTESTDGEDFFKLFRKVQQDYPAFSGYVFHAFHPDNVEDISEELIKEAKVSLENVAFFHKVQELKKTITKKMLEHRSTIKTSDDIAIRPMLMHTTPPQNLGDKYASPRQWSNASRHWLKHVLLSHKDSDESLKSKEIFKPVEDGNHDSIRMHETILNGFAKHYNFHTSAFCEMSRGRVYQLLSGIHQHLSGKDERINLDLGQENLTIDHDGEIKTCTICQDILSKNPDSENSNEPQEEVTYSYLLPCRHVFHTHCIKKWWKQKKHNDARCPICKAQITEEPYPHGYFDRSLESSGIAADTDDDNGKRKKSDGDREDDDTSHSEEGNPPKKMRHVLIVGDRGVGKTKFRETFQAIQMQNQEKYGDIVLHEAKQGSRISRSVWPKIDLVIVMFSVIPRSTFHSVNAWRQAALDVCRKPSADDKGPRVLLVESATPEIFEPEKDHDELQLEPGDWADLTVSWLQDRYRDPSIQTKVGNIKEGYASIDEDGRINVLADDTTFKHVEELEWKITSITADEEKLDRSKLLNQTDLFDKNKKTADLAALLAAVKLNDPEQELMFSFAPDNIGKFLSRQYDPPATDADSAVSALDQQAFMTRDITINNDEDAEEDDPYGGRDGHDHLFGKFADAAKFFHFNVFEEPDDVEDIINFLPRKAR